MHLKFWYLNQTIKENLKFPVCLKVLVVFKVDDIDLWGQLDHPSGR